MHYAKNLCRLQGMSMLETGRNTVSCMLRPHLLAPINTCRWTCFCMGHTCSPWRLTCDRREHGAAANLSCVIRFHCTILVESGKLPIKYLFAAEHTLARCFGHRTLYEECKDCRTFSQVCRNYPCTVGEVAWDPNLLSFSACMIHSATLAT